MRFVLFLAAALAVGCAVQRKPAGPPQTQQGSLLPAGVRVSNEQRFVVRAAPLTLRPGEENTLTFQVVGADLAPVDLERATLTLKYAMPSMPQMGVFTATPRKLGGNRLEADLDIVHGGGWRVTLGLFADERGGDTVVFDYDVR